MGIRRCVACTRRCSFRQAKTSGWGVVELVAAALQTTDHPPKSEGFPVAVVEVSAPTKPAKRQRWRSLTDEGFAVTAVALSSKLMCSFVRAAGAASSVSSAVHRLEVDRKTSRKRQKK